MQDESKQQQVLVFSFDRPTMPETEVHFPAENSTHKLSLGWYNADNRSATVLTSMLNRGNYRNFLNDSLMQQRYEAGSMLLAIDKRLLIYSLNNRDWLMEINLNNSKKMPDRLTFTSVSAFATHSNNNVKIYAAWLMSQFHARQMQSLRDIPWLELYELFAKINADNPCTIILSDGLDTVFYQGSDFSNSLYYVRSCPPHDNCGDFKSEQFDFHINSLEFNHTLFFVSSEQIQHRNSRFFNLHQMMVVRSAEIVWNKDPNAWQDHNLIGPTAPEPVVHHDYLHRAGVIQIPGQDKSTGSITIPAESKDPDPRIYSIIHRTCYEYDAPVYLSKHLFRLQPFVDLRQSILDYELVVLADGYPVKSIPSNFISAFGNSASYIEVCQPYRRLEVICRSVVTLVDPPVRRFDLLHSHATIPLIWMPWERIMMQAYLIPPELPESELRELSAYALSFVNRNGNDVYEVLNDINRTIYQDYVYQSGSTTLATTPFEVYVNHRGVCQDFANLFICLARLLNIPARYRTGYVYTATDYENQIQGDASHAWLEVFLPYVGWQGYDPTNYCLANKNHIRLACGRTFNDATPTSGTIFRGGGTETMHVDVRVSLLDSWSFTPSSSRA